MTRLLPLRNGTPTRLCRRSSNPSIPWSSQLGSHCSRNQIIITLRANQSVLEISFSLIIGTLDCQENFHRDVSDMMDTCSRHLSSPLIHIFRLLSMSLTPPHFHMLKVLLPLDDPLEAPKTISLFEARRYSWIDSFEHGLPQHAKRTFGLLEIHLQSDTTR